MATNKYSKDKNAIPCRMDTLQATTRKYIGMVDELTSQIAREKERNEKLQARLVRETGEKHQLREQVDLARVKWSRMQERVRFEEATIKSLIQEIEVMRQKQKLQEEEEEKLEACIQQKISEIESESKNFLSTLQSLTLKSLAVDDEAKLDLEISRLKEEIKILEAQQEAMEREKEDPLPTNVLRMITEENNIAIEELDNRKVFLLESVANLEKAIVEAQEKLRDPRSNAF